MGRVDSRVRTRRTGAVFALCASALVTAPASAQSVEADGPDAHAVFLQGQTAYQQGNYEAAILSWNQAFTLDPQPLIQLNLSQAYERLGRPVEAAAALDRYLSMTDPSDVNRANAQARRDALGARLSHTGIVFEGGPAGARVIVDDRDEGVLPRPDGVHVEPGAHRVVIRLAGYRDFRSSVVVPAGGRVSVDLTTGMQERPALVLPWIIAGAGAAMVVTGIVLGNVALGQADDASSDVSSTANGARTLAAVADGLWIAGTIAVAVGTLWWLLGRDEETEDAPAASTASVTVVPTAGPAGAGVLATGRF